MQAQSIFTNHGMNKKYGTGFEKMFYRCVNNAKAIFTGYGEHCLNGIDWIKSVINESVDLLNDFNRFCLDYNINAILCNRANILIFKNNNKGVGNPLKKVNRQNLDLVIESG